MSSTINTQRDDVVDHAPRRLTTETKSSFKTTEFLAFVGMVLAVVISANLYDGSDAGHGDPFGATTAMRYVVYLTIGYMVARGIAKSGSRERYDA
jgi:hypothetical protein